MLKNDKPTQVIDVQYDDQLGSGSETGGTKNSTSYNAEELSGLSKQVGNDSAYDVINAQDYYQNKIDQSAEGTAINKKHMAEADAASTKSANFVASNANKANENYVRNEYQTNQMVDKAGWSGGYALDARRQLDYLKSAIQADIYGQQELQKLGYTSALEQAKMAAEQERHALANERYRNAQQEAITKANQTGYYIEPHVADMLVQVRAAQDVLNKNPNDEKAIRVRDYIVDQFNKMGIKTKTGENGYITYKGVATVAELDRLSREALEKFKMEAAIEQAKDNSYATGAIPKFSSDGKIMSFNSKLPGNKEQQEQLKQYFDDNPDELKKVAQNVIKSMVSDYESTVNRKEEKNGVSNYPYKDLSFNDYITKHYSGIDMKELISKYDTNNIVGTVISGNLTWDGNELKYNKQEQHKKDKDENKKQSEISDFWNSNFSINLGQAVANRYK